MERFVPCQVTDKLDCTDCVFRVRSLAQVEAKESFIIRQGGFGFSTKDSREPTDEMSKSQQIVLNLCTSITGRKYVPQNDQNLSKRGSEIVIKEKIDYFLEQLTPTTLL